jgi:hypothetical protein
MSMRNLIAALLAVYCLSAAASIIIIETALIRAREAAKSIAFGAESVGVGSNPLQKPYGTAEPPGS